MVRNKTQNREKSLAPGHFTHCGRGILLLLSIFLLSGCVTIHWKGKDGKNCHLGFFGYSKYSLSAGDRLHVRSIGLDLYLLENRDIAFGYINRTYTRPEKRSLDLEKVGEEIIAFRETPPAPDPYRLERGWPPEFLRESVSTDAVIFQRSLVGVIAGLGPRNWAFYSGYNRRARLPDMDVQDPVVHIFSVYPTGERAAVLWQLKAEENSMLNEGED